ncbi:MAG: SurA N-terminal domain-containing protein [Treponema sp.]|jgi:parvulin-like peptidyl-prolyl isomerase|nr:SurA N-terminal domain-containing protein [Treponema sp.]
MKRFFIGVTLCLGVTLSLFGQIDAQTVAMINLIRQEPITVRQLKAELAPLEQAEGRSFTVAERREALDLLINQRLILQAAERDRITVSENEIDSALRNYLAQQAGRALTDAEYNQALRQAGTNVPTIRQQASRQLIMQKYLVAKKGDRINAVQEPAEADILRWYNINKSELRWPDIVGLSLIAVPYGADSTTKARARETANRLLREIGTNPAKFDEAVLRGLATSSGVSAAGGSDYASTRKLYIRRTREVQQGVGDNFFNVAFGLRQGEVSPLIEGIAAYQIIKVTEIYQQKFLELNDIVDPENPILVREYIRQILMAEQQQVLLNQAFSELVTELRAGRNVVTVYDQYLNW